MLGLHVGTLGVVLGLLLEFVIGGCPLAHPVVFVYSCLWFWLVAGTVSSVCCLGMRRARLSYETDGPVIFVVSCFAFLTVVALHPFHTIAALAYAAVKACCNSTVFGCELDDTVMPVYRQVRGGRHPVRGVPLRLFDSGRVLDGTLDGLQDGDLLTVIRLLYGDERVELSRTECTVQLDFRVVLPYLSRVQLLDVARTHDICLGRNRSLARIAAELEKHVCRVTCIADCWLIKRPLFTAQDRFRIYTGPVGDSVQSEVFVTMDALDGAQVSYPVVDPSPVHRFNGVAPIIEDVAGDLSGRADRVVRSRPRELYKEVPVTGQYAEPRVRAAFPPKPLDAGKIVDVVRNWTTDCSADALRDGVCAICAQRTLFNSLVTLDRDDACLEIIYEREAAATSELCSDRERDGVLCMEGVGADGQLLLCSLCHTALSKKHELPRRSLANGLWIGEVPPELSNLSFTEKLMVARYRHNVCAVSVGNGLRKMQANAIVFPQPVAKFYAKLPPTREELAECLSVVFTGPCAPTEEEYKRTPLLIRKNVVIRALKWLKKHHCDYTDLEISYENLEPYKENEPPVAWFYFKRDDGVAGSTLAVNESSYDRGTDEGPCTFNVHGVTTESLDNLPISVRKSAVLKHLREGGQLLSYGHASTPESIYHNPRLYPGMFPWLFPYGFGGFENERMTDVLAKKTHIKWCLNYYDRRFATDEYFPYILFSQEQIRASSKGGFILTERRNYPEVVEKILDLDPDVLAELIRRGKTGEYVRPETDAERKCYEVISTVDHVAGHVPSSGTKKKYQRNEIRSTIYEYGVPMFFITFAPTESRSPICLHFGGMSVDLDSYTPLPIHHRDRVRAAMKNPVASAQFFNFMVQMFVKHILCADSDIDGVFGPTEAYYASVEQQGRLTLHLHLLLWIRGSFSPQEIRDNALKTNGSFQEDMIRWLEACHQGELTTCTVPEMLEKLEKDGRPPKGKKNAPWWPDPCTAMPEPPPTDDEENAVRAWLEQVYRITDAVLAITNIHEKDHSRGCKPKPSSRCKGRFPRFPLLRYSFFEKELGALRLKKSEEWMNTFCIVLTYLFRCNTDVTCLLSGTQVRAVIAYVTDYITKMGLKSHVIFEAVHAVMTGHAEIMTDSPTRTEAARRLVTKVVNSLTSQQETGGPMLCSELLGLPDHYTNKRYKVCFWYSYVSCVGRAWDINEEDCPTYDTQDTVMLGRKEGSIIARSKVNDYVCRPVEMESMSLHEYLASTKVVKINASIKKRLKKQRCSRRNPSPECGDETRLNEDDVDPCYSSSDSEDDSEDSESDVPSTGAKRAMPCFRFRSDHPDSNSHCVQLLPPSKRLIVNFAGGLLPRKDRGDREFYCRTMLTLFFSSGWRTGRELKDANVSWDDAYRNMSFHPYHVKIMENMNVLYECQDARDDFAAQRRAEDRAENAISFLSDDILDELDREHDETLLLDEMVDSKLLALVDNTAERTGKKARDRKDQRDRIKKFMIKADTKGRALFPVPSVNIPADSELEIPTLPPQAWRELLVKARDEARARMFRDADHSCDDMDDKNDSRGHAHLGNVKWLSLQDLQKEIDAGRVDAVIPGEVSQKLMEVVANRFELYDDQRRAFEIICTHLTTDRKDPIHMFLGGMAGTGKSRVIQALTYFFEARKESGRFVLAAPTGSAASIIGGSTYHSLLAFGKKTERRNGSLGAVRERLMNVNAMFFDEISMVSCADLYDISAKLFAGDFAQLPPPGPAPLALYSSKATVRAAEGTTYAQKSAIGRALWHSFTTVVVLKKNMRQKGQSMEDQQFRTALENMRYARCTEDDVRLLKSRIMDIDGAIGRPHIGMPQFRDQSIALSWNTHRDGINEISVVRFAQQRGCTLHHFHSRDRIRNARAAGSVRKAMRDTVDEATVDALASGISERFQRELWELPPTSMEHVPGILSLCVGLPVILKHNEATELCACNRAEGFVVAWNSESMPNGTERLLVVFVRLAKPIRPIKLDGLPEGVVPVACTVESITCDLSDDKTLARAAVQIAVRQLIRPLATDVERFLDVMRDCRAVIAGSAAVKLALRLTQNHWQPGDLDFFLPIDTYNSFCHFLETTCHGHLDHTADTQQLLAERWAGIRQRKKYTIQNLRVDVHCAPGLSSTEPVANSYATHLFTFISADEICVAYPYTFFSHEAMLVGEPSNRSTVGTQLWVSRQFLFPDPIRTSFLTSTSHCLPYGHCARATRFFGDGNCLTFKYTPEDQSNGQPHSHLDFVDFALQAPGFQWTTAWTTGGNGCGSHRCEAQYPHIVQPIILLADDSST